MPSELRNKVADAIKTLFPGYFAYVMATGIVAAALNAFGYAPAAKVLIVLAALGYLKLWILTIFRAVRYPTNLIADFTSFSKGPGFFTIIAATGVLGAVAFRLFQAVDLAYALFWLGAALWVALIYSFATVVIVSAEKPTADRVVNGGWLVIVVSTQSLSILSSLLNDRIDPVVPTGFFMVGAATYLLLITLIVSRLLYFRVEAADLAPPYWIMMGAAAISCLAGVELSRHAGAWLNVDFYPLIQAFTLFFWMVATAWIPLLLVLGAWRHGFKRVPLKYEPQLWSMVFPLGMYTFATHSASQQFKLPFLEPIAAVFLRLACFAWLCVFVGLIADAVRILRSNKTIAEQQPPVGALQGDGNG